MRERKEEEEKYTCLIFFFNFVSRKREICEIEKFHTERVRRGTCFQFILHSYHFHNHHHHNSNNSNMTRTSVLADALNAINNAEKTGKRQVLIRPSSKVIIRFLTVMQKHGYIGEFEYIDDHRSGKIVVQLNGRLNKCGVISPRFNVKIGDIERWTDNLLPARQFGYVILTTSAGIMDHEEARRKHVSGKILGFVY